MNDKKKLQEARKQMAAWLLMEQDDSFLPSGSGFFSDVAASLGRIGTTVKKSVLDVASSTWGLLGILKSALTLDHKKAEEKYQAAKRRSQRIEAQYRSTRDKINQTLSSPGVMLALGGALGPGIVATDYVLGSLYNGIKDPIQDFGGRLDDKINDDINRLFPAGESKRQINQRASTNVDSDIVEKLKKLFYESNIRNESNTLFELSNSTKKEKSAPQEDYRQTLAKYATQALKGLFGQLYSAHMMANTIAQQIKNYNSKMQQLEQNKDKIKQEDKKKLEEELRSIRNAQSQFLKSKISDFEEILNGLKSVEFLQTSIGDIRVSEDLKSWEEASKKIKSAIPGSFFQSN